MRLRYVFPLLIASAMALAYAAPTRSHTYDRSVGRRLKADTIAASLDVAVGPEVTFNLHVTNSSPKRVELRFPNGQTHEIVVLDAAGKEVWRWSHGRMFTQGMQNRVLASSDTITYSESWRPDSAGTYTAVASLLSENYPVEQRIGFSLPPTSKAVSFRDRR